MRRQDLNNNNNNDTAARKFQKLEIGSTQEDQGPQAMEIVQSEDSASPLTNLPTDILGEVVQYLPIKGMAALASTCKYFGNSETGVLAEFREILQIIQGRDKNKGELYPTFMTSVIKMLNKNESLDWQQKIDLLRFAALPEGNNRYSPQKSNSYESYSELKKSRVVEEIWNNLASEEQQLFRSAFTFYESISYDHAGSLKPWTTRVECRYQDFSKIKDSLKNNSQLTELVIYDCANMQIKDLMHLLQKHI